MAGELLFASQGPNRKILKCRSFPVLKLDCDCAGGGGMIGGGCNWNVIPGALSFGAAGGSLGLTMHTQDGCQWEAVVVSGSSWLSVVPSSGIAGLLVIASAGINMGLPRSGRISFRNLVPSTGFPAVHSEFTSVQVDQAGVPVPDTCPPYPPLLDTYHISGTITGRIRSDNVCITPAIFVLGPADYNGTDGTCIWNHVYVNSAFQFIRGTISLQPGFWQFFWFYDEHISIYSYTSEWRKYFGSDPTGTYTLWDGCGGGSVNVTL